MKRKEVEEDRVWEDPEYKMYTEYGRIKYMDWIEKEIPRLQRGRKRKYYIKEKKGLVAIFIKDGE